MHLFGVVVWLGGLMFHGSVFGPVAEAAGRGAMPVERDTARRFVGFIWMSVWTVAVTGAIMMLASPRFLWFTYQDRWSVLLAWKQAVFVLMLFYAFGYARMAQRAVALASGGGPDEEAALCRNRLRQYRTLSIFLGILALLLGTAMVTYG